MAGALLVHRHRHGCAADVAAAVDESLGACFFGIMPSELQPCCDEFGIPPEYAPIGAITIGHRAADLPPQGQRVDERRRYLDDVVHRGHWGRH